MTLIQRSSATSSSAWVSASAGTGKTRVLIERVLRLLLAGAPANHILCITFTRAAAAEISQRIHRNLSEWTVCSDEQLEILLEKLLERMPEKDELQAARSLFTRVLDTPEGVRVKTIHGFCESLLAQFPLEANIAPHFSVMDERSMSELMQKVRDKVLASTLYGEGELSKAVAVIAVQLSEDGFNDLLASIIAARGRVASMLERFGGRDGLLSESRCRLGLEAYEDEKSILRDACRDGVFDMIGLSEASEAMLQGGTTDQRHAIQIKNWIDRPETRAETFQSYLSIFLTKRFEIRQTLIHKDALNISPRSGDVLANEAIRLIKVRDRSDSARVLFATEAVLTLAEHLITAYADAKSRQVLLDYDDLILTTKALLHQPEVAPWVLFKLDGGIDHILIDEAQDTSPDQWEVIAALADEFFSGQGARDDPRTIFAVGDTKQSIFSFQGANPAAFSQWRDHFAQRATDSLQDWRLEPLELSYRSTPPILQAVDCIFSHDDASDGLLLDGSALQHFSSRAEQSGTVELWPVQVGIAPPEPTSWSLPTHPESQLTPSVMLARQITHQITAWLRDAELLKAHGRPVRPGDIMILVQRRSGFMNDMIRSLKAAQVPVAGIDRMVLNEQLAVMDLMAIGRFALMPGDDLNTAIVLKSPLVGMDEDDLFELANGRGNQTLWQVLIKRSAERKTWSAAYVELETVLARADFIPPYELYAGLLNDGARRRLLARLGTQANDPVDEFLGLALAYERDHIPTLEGFLHWLAARPTEIKRDKAPERDEVQVMTVHGAKGLEAPIVFLPDTCHVPKRDPELLWFDGKNGETLLWSPQPGKDDPISRSLRDEERRRRDQEYRRLFYVALTRASDRLYICGWKSSQNLPEDCWYNLARRGLEDVAEPVIVAGQSILRLESAQERPPDRPSSTLEPVENNEDLPVWISKTVPEEIRTPRPLSPSRLEAEEIAHRSPLTGKGKSPFLRGRLIHWLLQKLSDQDEKDREAAARQVVSIPTYGLTAGEQAEIVEQTIKVLADPNIASVFGPGSRAEVPLAGRIGDQIISGQVDRIQVSEDAVTLVDFKTNREVPLTDTDVAPIYVRQMAAYRAALTLIYPNKSILCFLIWTDGPRVISISKAMLDQATLRGQIVDPAVRQS